MIIFVSIPVILIILALSAVIGWMFISNLLNICFIIMMLFGLIVGIYILGANIGATFTKGNPLFLISGIALGLFSAVGLVYTWCSLELNPADDYYILGEITSDSRLVSIIVYCVIVVILFIMNSKAKNPEISGGSFICLLITFIIAAYCLFLAVVCTKSYSDNTLKEYDFSTMTTEYQLNDDAKIYYFDSEKGAWPIQFDFLQLPFGNFEAGDEVYELSSTSSNGRIEVSDGEKCGYVKEEDLEPLYTYSWQAIEDNTPIYEAIPYEQPVYASGKPDTVTFYSKGENVIGYLSAGETVERVGSMNGGIIIQTSDGYGMIDAGTLEEVRVPIE